MLHLLPESSRWQNQGKRTTRSEFKYEKSMTGPLQSPSKSRRVNVSLRNSTRLYITYAWFYFREFILYLKPLRSISIVMDHLLCEILYWRRQEKFHNVCATRLLSALASTPSRSSRSTFFLAGNVFVSPTAFIRDVESRTGTHVRGFTHVYEPHECELDREIIGNSSGSSGVLYKSRCEGPRALSVRHNGSARIMVSHCKVEKNRPVGRQSSHKRVLKALRSYRFGDNKGWSRSAAYIRFSFRCALSRIVPSYRCLHSHVNADWITSLTYTRFYFLLTARKYEGKDPPDYKRCARSRR